MGIIQRKKRILLNEPHIETTSGSIASFNSDVRAKLKECKVEFLPVQSGSGDPSPTNIRPISGWDGMAVQRAGKNLFSENGEFGKWTNSSGVINNTMNGFIGEIMPISPDQMLSVGYWGIRPYSFSIIELNKDKEFIKRTHKAILPISSSPPDKLSTVTTQDTKYVYVQVYAPNTSIVMSSDVLALEKITVELGDSLTAYESFNGSSFTATFPSTQYGGYVDLARGVIVQEYAYTQVKWGDGGSSSTLTNNERRRFPFGVAPSGSQSAFQKCNIAPYRYDYSHDSTHFYVANNGYGYVFLPIGTDDETVIEITAKLATPIEIPITPQIIKALKGTNNIWSNANGDVSVKYWTH